MDRCQVSIHNSCTHNRAVHRATCRPVDSCPTLPIEILDTFRMPILMNSFTRRSYLEANCCRINSPTRETRPKTFRIGSARSRRANSTIVDFKCPESMRTKAKTISDTLHRILPCQLTLKKLSQIRKRIDYSSTKDNQTWKT